MRLHELAYAMRGTYGVRYRHARKVDTMHSLLDRVYDLNDVGHKAYVVGFTTDLRYALIVIDDNVTVCHVDVVNGFGKWECSARHLWDYFDVYAPQFPIQVADLGTRGK